MPHVVPTTAGTREDVDADGTEVADADDAPLSLAVLVVVTGIRGTPLSVSVAVKVLKVRVPVLMPVASLVPDTV